jgi:hypothetical protein
VSPQGGLSVDKSYTSSPECWTFENGAVALDVPKPPSYDLACGSYTMKLHVLTPNNKSGSQGFTLAAP